MTFKILHFNRLCQIFPPEFYNDRYIKPHTDKFGLVVKQPYPCSLRDVINISIIIMVISAPEKGAFQNFPQMSWYDIISFSQKFSTPGSILKMFTSLSICQWELLNLQFSTSYTSFNVWVRYFVWNFKGYLWNSTQNIIPIHWKIHLLFNVENLTALRFTSLYAFLKRPPLDLINF